MIRVSSDEPIDGDILAPDDGMSGFRGAARAHDDSIIEAEFTELGQPATARPLARDPGPGAGASRAVADVDVDQGLGILSGGSPVTAVHGQPGGAAFWSLSAMAIAAAFWFSGGHVLIAGSDAGLPDGLAITALTSRIDVNGLRFDATIENHGTGEASIPAVIVSVTARDGGVRRYKLGTSRAALAPGATHLFSGSLAAPKVGVERVTMRLAL